MAEDLMTNEALDHCLVVGAEEADWLLCDAYRQWRLLRSQPPVEPFHKFPRGMILSEGAGAILLTRTGSIKIEKTHAGADYRRRDEAAEIVQGVLSDLIKTDTDFIIASANGTFIDKAECHAISRVASSAITYTVKPALGESVGAGGLAAQGIRHGQLPPLLHPPPAEIPFRIPTAPIRLNTSRRAVVMTCGLNQQIAGLSLGGEN